MKTTKRVRSDDLAWLPGHEWLFDMAKSRGNYGLLNRIRLYGQLITVAEERGYRTEVRRSLDASDNRQGSRRIGYSSRIYLPRHKKALWDNSWVNVTVRASDRIFDGLLNYRTSLGLYGKKGDYVFEPCYYGNSIANTLLDDGPEQFLSRCLALSSRNLHYKTVEGRIEGRIE